MAKISLFEVESVGLCKDLEVVSRFAALSFTVSWQHTVALLITPVFERPNATLQPITLKNNMNNIFFKKNLSENDR